MTREFIENIAKELGNAEVVTVNKNGVEKIGLSVRVSERIGVNVYPDSIEGAETVEEYAEKIREIVSENIEGAREMQDLSELLNDYENVAPRLSARLYHKSVPAEVKRSAKAKGFDDLIIVPYVELKQNGEGLASVKVNKKMVEMWGVTQRAIIDTAIKNTLAESNVKSMFATLCEMTGNVPEDIMPDPFNDQLVVTTNAKQFGAAAILGLIDDFKEKYPDGFFVLPSSLHEVLVVPSQGNKDEEIEHFNAMVQEVNRTTVEAEDVLSNKAYYFA